MAVQGGCDARDLVVHDSLAPLEGVWKELAARGTNVFATWEWASLWCRHFGADHPLRILTVPGSTGETAAIVPLYLSTSRPFRVARFVGHGPADLLGAVADPLDVKLGPAAVAEAHAHGADWDLFVGECILGCEDWVPDLPGSRLSLDAFPTIAMAGETWDSYLAAATRNFRQKIGWRSRRLEAQLRRRHQDDLRPRPPRGRPRQPRRAAPGPLAVERRVPRHARNLPPRVRGRRCSNRMVAALGRGAERPARGRRVVYRFGGVDYFYQMGRDRTFDDDAVGFVLTAHVVRDAFESGVSSFACCAATSTTSAVSQRLIPACKRLRCRARSWGGRRSAWHASRHDRAYAVPAKRPRCTELADSRARAFAATRAGSPRGRRRAATATNPCSRTRAGWSPTTDGARSAAASRRGRHRRRR